MAEKFKILVDGTKVPWETRTKNTSDGYVLLTPEEIAEEDSRTVDMPYDKLREKEYIKKEESGELPKLMESIDLIYRTLEYLELKGLDIPKEMSSIIRKRRAIKNKYPKEGK